MNKGFTLLELLVTVGLISFVLLAGITLEKNRLDNQINLSRLFNAASLSRSFFSSRKDIFNRATNAPVPESFTSPLITGGSETLKSLTIDSRNAGGTVRDKLYHECNTAWPFEINLSDSLTTDQRAEIEACSGCAPENLPEATIERFLPEKSATKQFPLVTGRKTGLDGNPITSILCMKINGTVVSNNYTDIRMDLLVLVRTTNNQIKLLRYNGNFPKPKSPDPNGIKIMGRGG